MSPFARRANASTKTTPTPDPQSRAALVAIGHTGGVRLCLGLVVLFVAGCLGPEGPVLAEVMRFDGAHGYEQSTEVLPGVLDIHTGQGERYAIRGRPVLTLEGMWNVEPGGEIPTWPALREASRFTLGSALDVRVDYDPWLGRYVPLDAKSLEMTTLMYHLGHVQEMFDAWDNDNGAGHSPIVVGIDGQLTLRAGLPIDLTDFGSQVSYQPFGDAVVLSDRQGRGDVPIAYAGGIVGHEVSHRYMFHNVIVNGAWEHWVRMLTEMDWDRSNPLSLFDATHEAGEDMLRYRAFDEGMANLFGGAHAGHGQIYHEQELDPETREGWWTQDNDLRPEVPVFWQECSMVETSSTRTLEQVLMTSEPYEAGPPITRVFWAAAGKDADRFREKVAPAIIAAMPEVAAHSKALSDEAGHFRFSMGDALRIIADHLESDERNNYCAGLSCEHCTITVVEEAPPSRWGIF